MSDNNKDTSLETLPEDWEVLRIGELADIKYGKANPKSQGTIPIVGSGGIFDWTNVTFVDFPTIVIGRKGTAGRAWLMEEPSYPSDTTFYMSWKKEVDIRYLFYYLCLSPISGEYAKTTLPSLTRTDLENKIVPVPPLPEQRAIALVLTTIRQSIEATKRVILAALELKRSMMKYLFTYGPISIDQAAKVSLKETEIGEIPEKWKLSSIAEILSINIRNGIYKPRELYGKAGVKIIQLNDIYSNGGRIETYQLDTIDVNDSEKVSYEIKTGDFIINRVSKRQEGVGALAIVGDVNTPVIFESNMFRVRIDNNKIESDFLFHFGQSDAYRKQAIRKATKGNQTSINQEALKSFCIPLPDYESQVIISNLISTLNQKVKIEENRKVALHFLFTSLLNQLMTGKLRVP